MAEVAVYIIVFIVHFKLWEILVCLNVVANVFMGQSVKSHGQSNAFS